MVAWWEMVLQLVKSARAEPGGAQPGMLRPPESVSPGPSIACRLSHLMHQGSGTKVPRQQARQRGDNRLKISASHIASTGWQLLLMFMLLQECSEVKPSACKHGFPRSSGSFSIGPPPPLASPFSMPSYLCCTQTLYCSCCQGQLLTNSCLASSLPHCISAHMSPQ